MSGTTKPKERDIDIDELIEETRHCWHQIKTHLNREREGELMKIKARIKIIELGKNQFSLLKWRFLRLKLRWPDHTPSELETEI